MNRDERTHYVAMKASAQARAALALAVAIATVPGTSMFGLKGSEDLGGGLNALFNLETGLQVMDGTTSGGRLWSRRAFVGVQSQQWGTLQAGRNLFIDSDGVWAFDPFVQQAFASASLVRGRNWLRAPTRIRSLANRRRVPMSA